MNLPLLPPNELSNEQLSRIRSEIDVSIEPASRHTRRRRNFLIAGVTGSLVVIAGGSAVAYSILSPTAPTDTRSARCYSELSKNFGSDFPGATVTSTSSSTGDGGNVIAPVSTCTDIWRQLGPQLGHGGHPRDITPPYTPPHMVGCVLPDGTAAVFPGPNGACQGLGLHPAISK